MSLNQMKLVNIVGDLEDLDAVAAALGDTGVFQPDEAAEYYSDSENLIPLIASDDFSPVLDRLTQIMTDSGIRPDIVDSERFDHTDLDTVRQIMDDLEKDLGSLITERDECTGNITGHKDVVDKMRHFIGLGIDVSKVVGCQFIVTRFGRLPNESYQKLADFTENPFVEFFPCTHDGEYYWGVYAAPLGEAEKIDRIFSRLYFEKVDVQGIEGTPKEYVAALEQEIAKLEMRKRDLDTRIDAYVKEHRQELLELYTALCKHHAYLSIKQHACKYFQSFVLVGWIPKEYAGLVGKALLQLERVEITFTKASEEAKHSPPVKLKNRFFFRPFEYYTGMYGMPNYRELDPSWFIACTYTLLFGIMFADVGQGIMLLIAAIYMYKKMKMPLGALLIPCSISSTVFGFIFGSVFGFEEALNPIYKALFGLDEKPIDVLEGQTTMMLIYAAVGIGVILLIIAMILNIISSVKRGEIGEALFGTNGLAGLIFYSALVFGLIAKFALNMDFMTPVYVLLLIVLPLILIFFREPLSKLIKREKNIFGGSVGSFIVDNIFEMFEVGLSYVTNTMSFLRVGAFILVHAGMMKVVFVLAGMFSPVGYVITVIIGNIVVMALEALLVGIQVLRLEYYELFSRFYIGDGRVYQPVTVQ
jgi:V/A-type H+-transporting ATPase subunit I